MVPKVKGSKPLFHPKEYLEAGLSIAQLLCFNPNQSLDRKMKKIKALWPFCTLLSAVFLSATPRRGQLCLRQGKKQSDKHKCKTRPKSNDRFRFKHLCGPSDWVATGGIITIISVNIV